MDIVNRTKICNSSRQRIFSPIQIIADIEQSIQAIEGDKDKEPAILDIIGKSTTRAEKNVY